MGGSLIEMVIAAIRAAENGAVKDVFGILVAALAGFAVLIYAAASDLFKLKSNFYIFILNFVLGTGILPSKIESQWLYKIRSPSSIFLID